MSDPLRVPAVRDRERPFDIFEFDGMCRETLDGDERRIVRQVGLDLALEYGSRIETVGDMLDLIASAGPQGRRQLVDNARVALGQPTIEDEQLKARQSAINNALPMTDGQGGRITGCSAPNCNRMPTHPSGSGALRPVADRRWWCDDHKHLAGPDDHLPPEPTYILGPGFRFRLNPRSEEAKRVRAEEEERRAEFEAKQRAREAEGERLAKLRQRYEEQTTISVAGIRLRNGTIVPQ
jgi:hypothetical protein